MHHDESISWIDGYTCRWTYQGRNCIAEQGKYEKTGYIHVRRMDDEWKHMLEQTWVKRETKMADVYSDMYMLKEPPGDMRSAE